MRDTVCVETLNRKERVGPRADPTSLMHEAYVRLVDARTVDWQDRAHFLRSPQRSCGEFSSIPRVAAARQSEPRPAKR